MKHRDPFCNLGKSSQKWLAQAGVVGVEDLHRLGAVEVFVRVKKIQPQASLNLLWALEGCLTGRDWRVVAREDRLRLLMQWEQACQRMAGNESQ